MTGWKPEEVIGDHFSHDRRARQPCPRPRAAGRRSWTIRRPSRSPRSTSRDRTAGSSRSRSAPSRWSTTRARSPASTARRATSASAPASSASCASPRSATATSSPRRPDLVWLTDAKGTFTFISDATRPMLGMEPTELMGRPYAEIFAPVRTARRRRSASAGSPATRPPSTGCGCRSGMPTGTTVLVEINGTGMTADGKFIGAHGAARDVSERDRLERDLRRQAGELAAGEERAHLARELHDSVTQALFSMTLVSRSVELLLDRDPEAARAQLAQLRDLQREALAEMRALIFELRPGNLEQDGLSRALRTHTRRPPGPDRAADRGREHARRAAAAARSRRSSTGSPRRRSTTSSSTPARARSGSRSAGSRAASGCGSRTTARASIRRASRTATSAWPGCAPGPTRSARGSRSRACPARARPSRSSCPNAAIAAARRGTAARRRGSGVDPRRMT